MRVPQVHEQGEMAVRIDENIDDTLANVEAGQGQLLKYLNTISSNRWAAFAACHGCIVNTLLRHASFPTQAIHMLRHVLAGGSS